MVRNIVFYFFRECTFLAPTEYEHRIHYTISAPMILSIYFNLLYSIAVMASICLLTARGKSRRIFGHGQRLGKELTT